MDEDWVYPALVLVGAEFLIAAIIASQAGFAPKPDVLSYSVLAAVAAFFAGVGWFLFTMVRLFLAGEANPTGALRQMWLPNRRRIAVFALGFQLVALQWAALGWLKQMIPLVSPFWADPLFAATDQAIFGADPWRYLHPALDPLGGLFDAAYLAWFPIKAAVMGAVLSLAAGRFKTRAMIAYFIITGLFGACGQFLFSSAGPIFYARLGLGDQFAGLPIHAGAALASDYLWQGYVRGVTEIGGGISAMPSLHVANAAWVGLVLTAMWRPLGLFGWAFYAAILVASVYLGWHYAIDGVAGTIMALVAWRLADRMLQRSKPGTNEAEAYTALGQGDSVAG